jgi:hypothetical protein
MNRYSGGYTSIVLKDGSQYAAPKEMHERLLHLWSKSGDTYIDYVGLHGSQIRMLRAHIAVIELETAESLAAFNESTVEKNVEQAHAESTLRKERGWFDDE